MKSRALAICVLFCILFAPSSAGAADHWLWPLEGHEVGKRFDLPNGPYGAGNRGVDLRSQVGAVVNSVAAGVVSYVGTINNIPIVVVDHGRERSTYQPVDVSVQVGDSVTAGQSIGSLLGAGSHCPDSACLHLGRKIGDDYLDPLALLSTGGRVRLISPDGPPPTPPFGGDGSLRRPVGGPITSPYGMRVHPITHERKLHDGTDFGVPCGTPVHAAALGTVSSRSF
ncbi:MAG: peptidoglycan DD-metalloendopeptidase family protein, partial [Aeromicrobium sp.]